MDRHGVLSSDGHAGLPPGGFREDPDPQDRETFDLDETFDLEMKQQIEMTCELEKPFLVKEINEDGREGRDRLRTGAWDGDIRNGVMDVDGVAGDVGRGIWTRPFARCAGRVGTDSVRR